MTRSFSGGNGAAPAESLDPSPTVRVCLAYDLGDHEEHRVLATFATLAEALVAAREFVDRALKDHYRQGCTGRELYQRYVASGVEVYVDAALEQPVFHGWHYAQKRCLQLCGTW
jgi:hypothetical protein